MLFLAGAIKKEKMIVQHMNKHLDLRLLCSSLSSAAGFGKAAEAEHPRSSCSR